MTTHIKGIRHWTLDDIEKDALRSRDQFRARRLAECREDFDDIFSGVLAACRKVVPVIHRITGDDIDAAQMVRIVSDKRTRQVLRCIGTPPISDDDLDTLSDAQVNAKSLRTVDGLCARVGAILTALVDRERFPWIPEGREPSVPELDHAVRASATLATANAILTERRGNERKQLEEEVIGLLGRMLTRTTGRTIRNTRSDAPKAGEFMTAVRVGDHGCDAIVGLADNRLLVIECKASNSEINSRKRLNKEVGADAKDWLHKFGNELIVPAAVIRGVFKPAYVGEAQDVPVAIFWHHRLDDLREFIESPTRDV